MRFIVTFSNNNPLYFHSKYVAVRAYNTAANAINGTGPDGITRLYSTDDDRATTE